MAVSLKSFLFRLLFLCGLVLCNLVSCSVQGSIQHLYPLGGGGCEGRKEFVKLGLSLFNLYSKFHFSPEEKIFRFRVGGSKERPFTPPPPVVSKGLVRVRCECACAWAPGL